MATQSTRVSRPNHHIGNRLTYGLDNLVTELPAELDVLLRGGTRADFPRSQPTTRPAAATRPASQRPGQPVLIVGPQARGAKD